MDSKEVMMKDSATPIILPPQLVASALEDPSRMAILEAPDRTGHIPLLPLPSNDLHAVMGSWPFQNSHYSCLGGLASTRVSIQVLSELVRAYNHKLLQRLDSTPRLVSQCSKLASPDVFSRSIRAMQQCFKDPLSALLADMSSGPPTDLSKDDFDSQTGSFEDVFSDVALDSVQNMISLVHVTCACAYLLHKDEDHYDWDGLFHHMLQWKHLLSDPDDLQCFTMAVDQLTCEHAYPLTISLSGGGSYDQQPYGEIFDMLVNGPAMRCCSMFLDGLECQRLYERYQNGDAQYFDRATDMVDTIITRLRDNPHTAGFLNIVDAVEFQLHMGWLHNPREVEVMLIINGKNYSGSSNAFENYKMAVIASCDRAMEPLGSKWRNKYYTVAIDWVRAVSAEVWNHQELEARSAGQDTIVLAGIQPHQFGGASPLSVASEGSESMDDMFPSSPSTLDLSTSMSSLNTDSSNSYFNSPTTTATGSPTWPATHNTAADAFRCHSCERNFSDRANLRRHERLTKAHGSHSVFPCLEPGCEKSYTRSDNLLAHANKAHGDSI